MNLALGIHTDGLFLLFAFLLDLNESYCCHGYPRVSGVRPTTEVNEPNVPHQICRLPFGVLAA